MDELTPGPPLIPVTVPDGEPVWEEAPSELLFPLDGIMMVPEEDSFPAAVPGAPEEEPVFSEGVPGASEPVLPDTAPLSPCWLKLPSAAA